MNTKLNVAKNIVAVVFFIAATIVFSCKGQINQSNDPSGKKNTSFEQIQRQATSGINPVLLSKSTQGGPDFRMAAKKVTPGVVHINSTWNSLRMEEYDNRPDPFRDFFGEDWFQFFEPQRGPVQSSASGVILTSDGYIITNNHVVKDADEIKVVLNDQRSYDATVIGTDPKTDLALLKINETNLIFIEFGNSDEVEVGEWVLAVGNPFNLASTVTAGIVSAKARNINILKDREAVESFIQTDAAVNPGNSGGALVNLEGKLIGINAAIATPTGAYAGYSFAIPVNIVKKVADDILNYGSVKRGYLGVVIQDMTSSVAEEHKVKFTPGVFIDSLIQGGAAMEAGVKPNDVVIRIDGKSVETCPQLQEMVAKHRPGEEMILTIVRNNEQKDITVKLKSSNEGKTAVTKSEDVLNYLGIEVKEISSKEKNLYGIKNGLKVLRIGTGKIKEFTSMKPGFIITRVDGVLINTKDDLIKAIEKKDGGVMIEGIYPGVPGIVYYGFGI